MVHLGTLAVMAICRYLSNQSRSPSSGGSRCVVCDSPAELVTTCCKTPLCSEHLRAWKADPRPCPCRR
jgi:hypothetical protein